MECPPGPSSYTVWLSALNQQRHRAVVDERNGHRRLEDSGFNTHYGAPRHGDEMFVKRTRLLGRGGGVETGAASLAAIAVERELRDDEQRTSGVNQASVHLARVIRKNAQVEDFVREVLGGGLAIGFGHAQQNQQSRTDLAGHGAVDFDARL